MSLDLGCRFSSKPFSDVHDVKINVILIHVGTFPGFSLPAFNVHSLINRVTQQISDNTSLILVWDLKICS